MPSERHIQDRLTAYLEGALPPQQAAEVATHLSGCPSCSEERDLLQEGRTLLRRIEVEPRPGFAVRVALGARDRKPGLAEAPWLRWAFGGLGAATVAAAALFVLRPQLPPQQPSTELMLAQRLDLYEDMTVMQNQEALEDLDVVSVLHTLTPEGTP